ncbi:hypothetical protein [Mucilaginibacter frigoritolerans]|uniref:hypothetical protein n=1 Tax=Mucilaginibacter frigoritolerans TaxID=652788 RepID=UPI0011A7D4BF|nr:hypothetical protein [Mucilaginibacter frigoritolerans]
MKDQFIEKYWTEEDVLFYIHFKDGSAVQQIEISQKGKRFLSLEVPVMDGSMLCDQSIDQLDFDQNDFITKDEFEKNWKY